MPREIGGIRYYELKEISEELDVTLHTLRVYVREGKLRGRKIAGKYIVTEEALREFLQGKGAEQSG